MAGVVRHRALVRPVVGHRVVGVGDGDDARAERDLVGAQAVRVAVAGEALVVVEDDRHRVACSAAACSRMTWPMRGCWTTRPPLGRRQRRRLVEDLLGDGHLADVVEQGGDPDPVDLGLGQLELARHRRRRSTAMSADGWPR